MSGNRYPEIEKELGSFYRSTSKATIMEIARDFMIQTQGEDKFTTSSLIRDFKNRKFLMENKK